MYDFSFPYIGEITLGDDIYPTGFIFDWKIPFCGHRFSLKL